MNDFDLIAPIYKLLSRIVFGEALIKAQCHFLKLLPSNSSVLILGGGDGRLLSQLDKSMRVDFVELSEKMMKLARQQSYNCEVNFIQGDENSLNGNYDIVITPFVLDCFEELHLKQVIAKLDKALKVNGLWVCTDFNANDNRVFSKLLISFMIFFFRVMSNLESNKLLNFFDVLGQKYTSADIKHFKGGLIRTEVFYKR